MIQNFFSFFCKLTIVDQLSELKSSVEANNNTEVQQEASCTNVIVCWVNTITGSASTES